jgi:hypothetical protein
MPKYHSMKIYIYIGTMDERKIRNCDLTMDVNLHAFYTSTLGGFTGKLLVPTDLTQGKYITH